MINNFMCDNCSHYMVCEKLKPLSKFHDSAKKDLMITLTMEDCADFHSDSGGEMAASEADE